jgi:hypothetical protein
LGEALKKTSPGYIHDPPKIIFLQKPLKKMTELEF